MDYNTTIYQNAVTNELFLALAAKLANRTTGSASATYLNWANKEWTWFKSFERATFNPLDNLAVVMMLGQISVSI